MSGSGFVIEPPVEPMLAKLADELPGRALSTSRSGMGLLRWSFAAPRMYSSRAAISARLDRYFPELHEAFLARLRSRLRARRGDRDCHAARLGLRCTSATPAPGGVSVSSWRPHFGGVRCLRCSRDGREDIFAERPHAASGRGRGWRDLRRRCCT